MNIEKKSRRKNISTLEVREACIEKFIQDRINRVKKTGWQLAQFDISEMIRNYKTGESYYLSASDCKFFAKKHQLQIKYFDEKNREIKEENLCKRVWLML